MGEFQLRITSQAARDLREIVAYIARDNPAAAERFGFALVEKAELLKTFPLLGKKVKGREDDRVAGQWKSCAKTKYSYRFIFAMPLECPP